MVKIISTLVLILSIVLFPPAALALISNNAVPGDATYPIKRFLEDIIYNVASLNPSTKAWFAAARSDKRFEEIKILFDKGKSAVITLDELVAQTNAAVLDISKITNHAQKEQLFTQVENSIDKYKESLKQLSDKAAASDQSQTSVQPTPIQNTSNRGQQQPAATQPPSQVNTVDPNEAERQREAVEKALRDLEESRKKAEEERKKAEEERKRLEEERKRSEQERSKSSNQNQKQTESSKNTQQTSTSNSKPADKCGEGTLKYIPDCAAYEKDPERYLRALGEQTNNPAALIRVPVGSTAPANAEPSAQPESTAPPSCTPPAIPTGLGYNNNSRTVSWNESSNVTYNVRLVDTTGTQHDFNGITNNWYTFPVDLVKSAGNYSWWVDVFNECGVSRDGSSFQVI
ncbi:hypothetical protein HYS92_01280 [Candidatus Daviesbacteria bacterium]|nr:hypothetical protein [Candidatus Daviesbacteria bacterium]